MLEHSAQPLKLWVLLIERKIFSNFSKESTSQLRKWRISTSKEIRLLRFSFMENRLRALLLPYWSHIKRQFMNSQRREVSTVLMRSFVKIQQLGVILLYFWTTLEKKEDSKALNSQRIYSSKPNHLWLEESWLTLWRFNATKQRNTTRVKLNNFIKKECLKLIKNDWSNIIDSNKTFLFLIDKLQFFRNRQLKEE